MQTTKFKLYQFKIMIMTWLWAGLMIISILTSISVQEDFISDSARRSRVHWCASSTSCAKANITWHLRKPQSARKKRIGSSNNMFRLCRDHQHYLHPICPVDVTPSIMPIKPHSVVYSLEESFRAPALQSDIDVISQNISKRKDEKCEYMFLPG